MPYRVCKAFDIESGHMLSKHPGRCRFPHGHTRRIEVVLAADELDANDMVCDFSAIKRAVAEHLDAYDHAMVVNSADPAAATIASVSDRVIVFDDEDPTTEALARRIYEFLEARLADRSAFRDGIRLERVRVGETPTSWAEFASNDRPAGQ
jgi:6-pyruvoyltetrahydropterin/6-carboxytetrahydropterin synthase